MLRFLAQRRIFIVICFICCALYMNTAAGGLRNRSKGFPARDIWFLHTVPQGSCQMGRVVGTPSPSSSFGFTWGLSPPGPPTLLDWQGVGLQNVRSHTRMLGPSVFPDSSTEGLAKGRVFRMLGPIPECLVLQCFQMHKSYQNAWSFSISRFTSHTRSLPPQTPPETM